MPLLLLFQPSNAQRSHLCSYEHNCRRYNSKTCIVTASTLGIGLAIATRLAEEGGNVVVSSRKQDQVDAVVKTLKDRSQGRWLCVPRRQTRRPQKID